MDKVMLRGLQVEAIIGIHEWERQVRQVLEIDLEVAIDTAPAAASERIEDACDYQDLADRVTGFIQEGKFQLLETLAHRLADQLQQDLGISWLRLQVWKPGAVVSARNVGVSVERGSGE